MTEIVGMTIGALRDGVRGGMTATRGVIAIHLLEDVIARRNGAIEDAAMMIPGAGEKTRETGATAVTAETVRPAAIAKRDVTVRPVEATGTGDRGA